MKKIVIGSRGSQLSLKQTEIIQNKLLQIDPSLQIEIKIITTKGDTNMKPIPLDSVGKGWFTKEIDRALLQKEIDIAVHSLKDLPESLPSGLIVAALPEREDAREALVSQHNLSLDSLPQQAVIGTDSTRRKAQILNRRPDIQVKSIRGNVNTRLAKLENEDYDAILLAVAGLKRLGLEKKISQYFAPDDFIPSPGQGTLAVVTRETDKTIINLVQNINDTVAEKVSVAERAFSASVGGGCKTPVGAYAVVKGKKIIIHGMIGSLDGTYIAKTTISGEVGEEKFLGKQLAITLLQRTKAWYTQNT